MFSFDRGNPVVKPSLNTVSMFNCRWKNLFVKKTTVNSYGLYGFFLKGVCIVTLTTRVFSNNKIDCKGSKVKEHSPTT